MLVLAGTLTLVLLRDILSDLSGRSLGNGEGLGSDPVQSMWYLHWIPWSLMHGQNPLVTDRFYVPDVVGLAWNTPVPTLGMVAAPATLTWGPVVTYNLLMLAAPVATAVTARYWLRRYVTSPWAANVGALVIAFSPFVSGHLQGHLNLSFIALVPLILAMVDTLLRTSPERPRQLGVLLGVVLAAQVGISEEILLITAIGVTVAVFGSAVAVPRATLAALRRGWGPLAIAVATAAAVAGPFLVSQLLLQRHVEVPGVLYRSEVADFFAPTDRVLSVFGAASTATNTFEQTAYIGTAMAALLLVVLLALGRLWWVRVAVTVFVLAGAACLGVGTGEGADRALPWGVVSQLPLVGNVLPARLSFLMALAAAFLVAIAWDRLSRGSPRPLRRLGLVTVAGCVLSWMPLPLVGSDLDRVPFFVSGATALDESSVILLLPMAQPFANQAQLWQSDASFRFRMYGGYALNRDESGLTSYGPPSSAVVDLVHEVERGGSGGAESLARARSQFRADGAEAIVVVHDTPRASAYRELARQLAGRGPDAVEGGVSIWRLVP